MTKEELLSDWLRINKLSANLSKTEYMLIGLPRKLKELEILPALELNKCEIKRVMKTKSLGIVVDDSLRWNDQFKALSGKLAVGLSSLKKRKNILPQSKLKY